MEVKITCTYCDHTIYKNVYDTKYLQGLKCEICGDKNLIMKDNAKEKIDSYAGCKPFKEEDQVKAPYWGYSGGD